MLLGKIGQFYQLGLLVTLLAGKQLAGKKQVSIASMLFTYLNVLGALLLFSLILLSLMHLHHYTI